MNGVEDIGFEDIMPDRLPGERYDLVCPDCSAPMRLRRSPQWTKPYYGCTSWQQGCRGNHGANQDGSPVGIPGNQETRKWRSLAHLTFGRLWEGPHPKMSQTEAYEWLRTIVGRSGIGFLDVAECQTVIEAVKKKYPEYKTSWDRLMGSDP